jgi:tRNA/tmRNA/rRNA uracil-C5-methylase (TrmA/RlmC/RlmD family)
VAAPVQRDDVVELDVESLAFGGNGVARVNGYVVFVRRGLPGDRVRARVTKVKRNHAEALALDVLSPGPQRVEAPCAHYPACGGCRFQDLAYEAQLEQKQRQVADSSTVGGIAEPPLEEIVRPSRSSITATSSSTRSRRHRRPALGFTRRVAGTRCSRSSAAG